MVDPYRVPRGWWLEHASIEDFQVIQEHKVEPLGTIPIHYNLSPKVHLLFQTLNEFFRYQFTHMQ